MDYFEGETQPEFNTHDQFVDDLLAANRFKIFLLGNGIEVPERVSAGIAMLISKYIEGGHDESPDKIEIAVESERPSEAP